MALLSGSGKSGLNGPIGKTAPAPPAELLFQVAALARLTACPLTTDIGPEEGITINEAVALVMSPSPVTPLLSDPDLAIVAKIAEDDPDHAETLRALIAAFRTDLAAAAEQIGDPVLSAHLHASAAAATGFDAEAHTLPLPEDDDLDIVLDAINEHVARVHASLGGTATVVPAQVVHRQLLRTLATAAPAVPIPPRSGDTTPLVRRVEEAAAIIRLSTRDGQGQQEAAMLTRRLYWQDEMLQQALDALTPADPTPTKSVLGTPGSANPASLITAIHVDHLAFSLGVSHGIRDTCAQRVAKTPPTAAPPSKAPAHGVPVPTRFTHRDPLTGEVRMNRFEMMEYFAYAGDHAYDPATDTWRELTPREKCIRNWGVAGGLFGWVAGSAAGVVSIPATGGTGPFILQWHGFMAGVGGGMKFGEWVADRYELT
ncbi:hypothetical protein [Spongiactinospora sp. TRM90649]|uniref:hypothetical protein n=1 Tax=Spongiactinospora sp. TRM90649 TaxID=3031114 RepID=UPI0023F94352|nr:hypothetical protein [Spongiactinospora sp. TRM90649]MDF5756741.1 hypothetical protein [Spongiactinospora sp. TRM90649]